MIELFFFDRKFYTGGFRSRKDVLKREPNTPSTYSRPQTGKFLS